MLIDWFTVVAQVLNFLILVWLLKRFLYRPILTAIDAREQRIASELAEADAKKADAEEERDEFQRKNAELGQQHASLMSQAATDAKAERQRLLNEARQAADALRDTRQDTLMREQQTLNTEIARRTRTEVFAIARKALMELAGESLESSLCDVFIRRLRELDGKAKSDLNQALRTTSEPALIRSAFNLQADQRAAIQKAINEATSSEINLRFETMPDVISGIELSSNGQKLAWSLANYMGSLGKSIDELLKKNHEPETSV